MKKLSITELREIKEEGVAVMLSGLVLNLVSRRIIVDHQLIAVLRRVCSLPRTHARIQRQEVCTTVPADVHHS